MLCLPLLGAADCPLQVGTSAGQPGSTATGGGGAIDLGGTRGALWVADSDRSLTVTLQSGKKVSTAKAEAGKASVQLGGQLIALADFCWRTDVVCPHQVLPEKLGLAQLSSGALLVGFNRRGPLAELRGQKGLVGRLDGNDIIVPLAVSGAARGFCALGKDSAVVASAFIEQTSVSSGSSSDAGASRPAHRAPRLQGRITVTYSGSCVVAGGSASALLPTDTLRLSSSFTARRKLASSH